MAKDTWKIIQALTYLANYQPDKMLDNTYLSKQIRKGVMRKEEIGY